MGESDTEETQNQEDAFVWDEETRLYFHASSGFYHDPNAGWYYNSIDGFYYKYENDAYVRIESEKDNDCQLYTSGEGDKDDATLDVPSREVSYDCNERLKLEDDEVHLRSATVNEESSSGQAEFSNSQEIHHPPPSEWLEDTLIDLYLSGYKIQPDVGDDAMAPLEPDEQNDPAFSANDENDAEELEEGEWIPEDDFDFSALSDREVDEGYSREEENWQAQYGQVIPSTEATLPDIPATDLWDWKMVLEPGKDGNGQVVRLVGRLVKRSVKLHPSLSSKATLLKTAPVCEAQLHLVRVKTGQVYRLRNPSAKYIASLSGYDSSNPTKDWGFPDVSVVWQNSSQVNKPKKATEKTRCNDSPKPRHEPDEQVVAVKQKGGVYRDRAAERRNLHGGFGVGPGQKRALDSVDDDDISSETVSTEIAAAQALDMSFGSNSYARKLLGNMGWKEGETLGKTMKGLTEPVQAVGNVGNAGLGYPYGRTKQV